MQALEPARRPLPEALALGPALVSRAKLTGTPQIAASLTDEPAIVLGAAQRASRAVDLGICLRERVNVVRRATTGIAAWLGGRAIVFTIALPHVASLFPDATPRTLLNRNVRPLLKGFAKAGVLSHYLGRDFLTLQKRPAALLGFDVDPSGAVLLEVFAGYDEPMAVPEVFLRHDETPTLDRWGGKRPASLAELLPRTTPEDITRAVLDGFAERIGSRAAATAIAKAELDLAPFQPITRPNDPVPEGFTLGPAVPVPIGFVEAAVEPVRTPHPRVWLGGDMLAPRWALERIAEHALDVMRNDADPYDIPLEGATLGDLHRAVQAAIAGGFVSTN